VWVRWKFGDGVGDVPGLFALAARFQDVLPDGDAAEEEGEGDAEDGDAFSALGTGRVADLAEGEEAADEAGESDNQEGFVGECEGGGEADDDGGDGHGVDGDVFLGGDARGGGHLVEAGEVLGLGFEPPRRGIGEGGVAAFKFGHTQFRSVQGRVRDRFARAGRSGGC
jgi:hypothetical protein